MKNQIIYLKIIFTVLALLVFQIEVLQAQIVGTDAYIKGTGIELGFNGNGGFEGADATSNPAPAGMHFRSNTQYFGFVANPQILHLRISLLFFLLTSNP